MNFQSLNSESTQQYQTIQINTEETSSFKGGTIAKMIQNNNFFRMINVIPYDVIDFRDEEFTKQNQPILGFGSFATVYQSFNILKNISCALKVHQNISEAEMQSITNEYAIQNKLNSKFQDYFVNLIDDVYIVQEDYNTYSIYAGLEQGIATLDICLKDRCLGIEEFQCLYHEILDSILKMHSLHIAHRDIKPHNILFLSRNKWVLCDFGCARIYQNKKEVHKIAGTKSYLPKNIRNKIEYYFFEENEMEMDLFQNDIYAFTLTMLQAYKKDSNILDLQDMIDQSNWRNIQDDSLQYLFQIYQKPYSYIKQHILINFQHVKINQEFVDQQFKIMKEIYQKNSQMIHLDFKLEKFIKLMYFNVRYRCSLQKISLKELLLLDEKKGITNTQSDIEFFEEFEKYTPIVQLQFYQVDEKKYYTNFKIDQKTKKWQFDSIVFYLMKKGNFNQQIQCCSEFQKYTEKHLIEIKLILIDRLMFIGQEQQAFIIIKQLEEISHQFIQIQTLILKIFQFMQNKIWLQQAYSLLPYIKISEFQIPNLLYYNLMLDYLNWVYCNKDFPCQQFGQNSQFEIELKLQSQILSQFEQICTIFSIQECPINQIINKLYARGSDCHGIFSVFYYLISASIYDCNYQLIKDLHLQIINFIESNQQLKHFFWLILLNYSLHCYKQQNYEESLQLQLRALEQVECNDNENQTQINIQIYYSLLKQFKYQKAQEIFTELVINVNKNSKGYFRELLVKKLLKGIQILFEQGNYVDLQFSLQLFRSTFQMDADIRIQSLLYKFEWEVLLTFQNQQLLINQFNSELFNLSKNSTLNDIELLKCIQNIKVISREQSQQSIETQNIYINFQEKITQDLIIFQDLHKFNQTETLNVESEIVKLLNSNKKGIINQQKALKMIDQLNYFM